GKTHVCKEETERETERQRGRQTDRHTHTHTHKLTAFAVHVGVTLAGQDSKFHTATCFTRPAHMVSIWVREHRCVPFHFTLSLFLSPSLYFYLLISISPFPFPS